jgi:hypothetical protein
VYKPTFVFLVLVLACSEPQARHADRQSYPDHRHVPIWPSMAPDAQSAPGPQLDWTNIANPSMAVRTQASDSLRLRSSNRSAPVQDPNLELLPPPAGP